MKKRFELSLDHPVLAQAKLGMNRCLNYMVTKAVDTGSMEGTATLKISMEIEEDTVEETGEIVRDPVIKFKAGWSVPIKENEEGKLPRGGKLVRNPDGEWCLINNQVTIDEVIGGAGG